MFLSEASSDVDRSGSRRHLCTIANRVQLFNWCILGASFAQVDVDSVGKFAYSILSYFKYLEYLTFFETILIYLDYFEFLLIRFVQCLIYFALI